jgi:hypothetical protein
MVSDMDDRLVHGAIFGADPRPPAAATVASSPTDAALPAILPKT